jgi:phosphatidate cytidylyltransferase
VNDKNRNLVVRIVSALLLLPVVIYLLIQGGLWFGMLGAVAAAACASEYYGIVFKKMLGPPAWLGILVAGALPLLPVFYGTAGFSSAFWAVGGFGLVAWTYHLIRGPLADAPTRVAHLVNGLVLGALGLSAMTGLRVGAHGLEWVLCALIITWGQDTSAYFAGRLLGRHKLYPAVSPNKTWEGFAGGFVGAVAGMFIARGLFFPELSVADCLIVGCWGGFAGPVGDLSESMLKRAYGVKDSGRLIPGHGGVLDRIDALLFNAPGLFAYVTFLRQHL